MSRFIRSIRRVFPLFCALAFGEYLHSAWNGEFDYAVYRWRGARYTFVWPLWR